MSCMIVSRNNIDHVPHCLIEVVHLGKAITVYKETHPNEGTFISLWNLTKNLRAWEILFCEGQ